MNKSGYRSLIIQHARAYKRAVEQGALAVVLEESGQGGRRTVKPVVV